MDDRKRVFDPLSADQAEFLRKRRELVLPLLPQYSLLVERLLGLAGLEVVLRPIDQYTDAARRRQEYDVAQLLRRGRSWEGPASRVESMQASDCHRNVAALHREGRGGIVTGWALAGDGLWREHSWVLSVTGGSEHLVETTTDWLLYHGFLLTAEESAWFVASELGVDAS